MLQQLNKNKKNKSNTVSKNFHFIFIQEDIFSDFWDEILEKKKNGSLTARQIEPLLTTIFTLQGRDPTIQAIKNELRKVECRHG